MTDETNWTAWLPLIGAVIGATVGLVGVAIGQWMTYWRERKLQRHKDAKDTAHLIALVAGALERFSEGCEAVAFDDGSHDEHGYLRSTKPEPLFEPDKLQVEWKALPPELMFHVLDLPYRAEAAERIIEGASEHAAMPPDFEEFFEQRQYQYAVLGADAARLAARLRSHAGMPARPENPHWNSIEQMDFVAKKYERQWEQRAKAPAATPESK